MENKGMSRATRDAINAIAKRAAERDRREKQSQKDLTAESRQPRKKRILLPEEAVDRVLSKKNRAKRIRNSIADELKSELAKMRKNEKFNKKVIKNRRWYIQRLFSGFPTGGSVY